MFKRLAWRIQPAEQIRKRKQRRREMWERHKQFTEYVKRLNERRGKHAGSVQGT